MPRIAVYAIALDEAPFAQRFFDGAKEADMVVVADTGSTDDTVARLRAAGAIVHQISISPWRFDDARNAALALVPADIDICVSLDLDEVAAPGWRAALERAWAPGTTSAFFRFHWSHDANGAPLVSEYAKKVHARRGFRWRYPCHEGLYPDRIRDVSVVIEDMVVDHWQDTAKSRAQYPDLLRLAVAENPHDRRCAFLLGRDLMMAEDWDRAIPELRRYLTLDGPLFVEERCNVQRFLSRCEAGRGGMDEALSWARRAADGAPHLREPWVDLAFLLYERGDWPACYDAARRALDMDPASVPQRMEASAWGPLPHDLASIAAWNLGLTAEALRHAREAHLLAPEDARLAGNVTLIEARMAPKTKG
ncbi:MAG: hypothetical protein AB7E69_16155 [Sphingomonadales bacterium]